MQMRFVSEDILIISTSVQAVIPYNASSPVSAHYLCHKKHYLDDNNRLHLQARA